jgi:hypothetical protein
MIAPIKRRDFITLIGGAGCGRVAASGACAAGGDAGDRVSVRSLNGGRPPFTPVSGRASTNAFHSM